MNLPWGDNGGDHYVTAEINRTWSTNTGASIIAPPIPLLPGHNAILLDATTDRIQQAFDTAITTLSGGFWFLTDSMLMSHNGFQFCSGSFANPMVTIKLEDNGRLGVYNFNITGTLLGSTRPIVQANGWYHLAWKFEIHNSLGTVDIYVDGVNELSLTGVDTVGPVGVASVDIVDWRGSLSKIYIDDPILEAGPVPPPIIAYTDYPIADDLTGWTPFGGGTHFSEVDDPGDQDDDTTYNSTNTAGAVDTFTFPALSGLAVIYAVKAVAITRRDDAGPHVTRGVMRQSATNFFGPNRTSTAAYLDAPYFTKTQPVDGSAWTQAAVNAMNPGYELQS